MNRRFRALLWLALLGGLLPARPLWAQGCVLCYTSAAAGGSAAMRGFEWGILALLTPALVLFLGVFFLIFLRARAAGRAQQAIASSRTRSRSLRTGVRNLLFGTPSLSA